MSLPGYDEWKTTDPADNWPTCERCGEYLHMEWRGGYSCLECEIEDEQRQLQADGEPTLIDLEDADLLMKDEW